MRSRSVLLLGLVACGGVDPETFNEEYAEHLCRLMFDCQEEFGGVVFGDDVSQCQGLFSLAYASAENTCSFDQEAAESCLDEMAGATCETILTSAMVSCASVYTGDGCAVTSGTVN